MRTLYRALIKALRDRRGEMDEAVIVFPLLLLIAIGLVNMGLLGVAAVNAGNAANYGARMGAVAQTNPAGVARTSAGQAIQAAPVGTYSISRFRRGSPRQHGYRAGQLSRSQLLRCFGWFLRSRDLP